MLTQRVCVCLFRLQAPLGGLLAALLPRAQIVPAVPLDQLSNDPIVVRQPAPSFAFLA